MRSHDEWSATPQAKALAALPVLTIEKIGEAAPKPWPAGDRPLSGVRVLDLSRVIAAPVAGRTLAAHGADVMLISGPELPAISVAHHRHRPRQARSVHRTEERGGQGADARTAGARQTSSRKAIARRRSPRSASRRRRQRRSIRASSMSRCAPTAMPGHGPARRGFDSLVQTSTGFNHAEGQAAGIDGPKELPAQMLDHATGYLMAFGAMMAKARQAREGGSWHVRVSLAQTGRWLWNLGRVADGLKTRGPEGRRRRALHGRLAVRLRSAALGAAIRRSCRKRRPTGIGPAMPLGTPPAAMAGTADSMGICP